MGGNSQVGLTERMVTRRQIVTGLTPTMLLLAMETMLTTGAVRREVGHHEGAKEVIEVLLEILNPGIHLHQGGLMCRRQLLKLSCFMKTDKFGMVSGLSFHDGCLLGVLFDNSECQNVELVLESMNGDKFFIKLNSLVGLLCDGLRAGSTVANIFEWPADHPMAEKILRKLALVKTDGNVVERAFGAQCLLIECADDCKILACYTKASISNK
jgi:hypothetical protein